MHDVNSLEYTHANYVAAMAALDLAGNAALDALIEGAVPRRPFYTLYVQLANAYMRVFMIVKHQNMILDHCKKTKSAPNSTYTSGEIARDMILFFGESVRAFDDAAVEIASRQKKCLMYHPLLKDIDQMFKQAAKLRAGPGGDNNNAGMSVALASFNLEPERVVPRVAPAVPRTPIIPVPRTPSIPVPSTPIIPGSRPPAGGPAGGPAMSRLRYGASNAWDMRENADRRPRQASSNSQRVPFGNVPQNQSARASSPSNAPRAALGEIPRNPRVQAESVSSMFPTGSPARPSSLRLPGATASDILPRVQFNLQPEVVEISPYSSRESTEDSPDAWVNDDDSD